MKCADVEFVLIEYTEGALSAADELCIDIHLIQCYECRAAIANLRELVGSVVQEVRGCEEHGDPIALLDRLHAIEPSPLVRRIRTRRPSIRICAAAALAACAVSFTFLGYARASRLRAFGVPIAEAHAIPVSDRDWAPYLRHDRGLLDLQSLGLVDMPRNRLPGSAD